QSFRLPVNPLVSSPARERRKSNESSNKLPPPDESRKGRSDRRDPESDRHPEVELRQVSAGRGGAARAQRGRARVGISQRFSDQGFRRYERARLRLVQPRKTEI